MIAIIKTIAVMHITPVFDDLFYPPMNIQCVIGRIINIRLFIPNIVIVSKICDISIEYCSNGFIIYIMGFVNNCIRKFTLCPKPV